jgi:hypothetical protein
MDTTDLDKSPDPQAQVVKRGRAGPVAGADDKPAAVRPFDPATDSTAGRTDDAAQRSAPEQKPQENPLGDPRNDSASHAERMFAHDDEDEDGGSKQDQFRKKYANVRLDRTRQHGVVAGTGTDGAHFEQDGFYFDNDGALVQSDFLHPPEKMNQLNARGKKDWARAKADAYYESLLNADPRTAPGTLAVEQQGEPSAAKFDLVAWAKGQRSDTPFGAVRAAAQEQYGYSPNSSRALIGFLIERRLLSREESRSGG